MVPTSSWRPKDWRRARELLRQVLSGVGRDIEVEEHLLASLQVRRLATEAERAVIGPAKDVRRE